MGIMIPAWVKGRLEPVEKLAAHQLGLKHQAVSVFVMSDDDVLLQRRALHKYHTPGLWANTCCTHPNWAEDPLTCAVRRLDEELGIQDLKLSHRGTVEYCANVGNGLLEHEVVDVFMAKATRDLKMDANPEEVMATRWVKMDALHRQIAQNPERFTPWLKIYLSRHKDMIFGDSVAVS